MRFLDEINDKMYSSLLQNVQRVRIIFFRLFNELQIIIFLQRKQLRFIR